MTNKIVYSSLLIQKLYPFISSWTSILF